MTRVDEASFCDNNVGALCSCGGDVFLGGVRNMQGDGVVIVDTSCDGSTMHTL